MIKIEGEEEGSSHTEIDGRSRTASENWIWYYMLYRLLISH
jgi:hypothetical protein